MRRTGHKPGHPVTPIPERSIGASLFHPMQNWNPWVNLTPHEIRVLDDAGNTVLTLPPSGSVARVSVTREDAGEFYGIPCRAPKFGAVTGLPEPTGQGFIVSAMVREASKGRSDVFSPGELVRGADGQPVGCRGLDSN